MSVYLITYTTRYRGGGAEFERAARTLAKELRARNPGAAVHLCATETKADFVREIGRIESAGERLMALHFLGHSGMYGIMFGTSAWPEQFSPEEWRRLRIPFGEGAAAYFHACRTARWFAPFFARTFGVCAYGHHDYTSVSTRKDRFHLEARPKGEDAPLYVISVPGRKTHGLIGSFKKYALAPRAQPMTRSAPGPALETGYDPIAELYDRAFADIRVRRDEWRWLSRHLARATRERGEPLRVLDLGCGNGALLGALRDRIATGVGVDTSTPLVKLARIRHRAAENLSFTKIAGPTLPFADEEFDVVTSLLSFRYLDWDPILHEIRRVLTPRGRLLLVDMAEKKAGITELPAIARTAVAGCTRRLTAPRFCRDLAALTTHPDWRRMLQYNPIRAHHEYAWYLESRFPGRHVETLNVGRRARILAFDSGPIELGRFVPQSYP